MFELLTFVVDASILFLVSMLTLVGLVRIIIMVLEAYLRHRYKCDGEKLCEALMNKEEQK